MQRNEQIFTDAVKAIQNELEVTVYNTDDKKYLQIVCNI